MPILAQKGDKVVKMTKEENVGSVEEGADDREVVTKQGDEDGDECNEGVDEGNESGGEGNEAGEGSVAIYLFPQ